MKPESSTCCSPSAARVSSAFRNLQIAEIKKKALL